MEYLTRLLSIAKRNALGGGTATLHSDLHLHTNCSDGLLTPQELVAKCAASGVQLMAIADHDTTIGYSAALPFAEKAGIILVPAVEVSCFENGKDIHVLAYGVDVESEILNATLSEIRSERITRATKIVARLEEMDVQCSLDEVLSYADNGVVGRPHIAKALVQNNVVGSVKEAFDRYLGTYSDAYVGKTEFSVERAIEVIHAAGGIAILAHPSKAIPMRSVVDYLSKGMDGLEVQHPSHTSATKNYLRGFCFRYNVIQTAGSDFHGTRDYDEKNFGRYSLSAPMLVKFVEGILNRQNNAVVVQTM